MGSPLLLLAPACWVLGAVGGSRGQVTPALRIGGEVPGPRAQDLPSMLAHNRKERTDTTGGAEEPWRQQVTSTLGPGSGALRRG